METPKNLSKGAASSSGEVWSGERQEQRKELGNITKVRVRAKVQVFRESGGHGDLGGISDVHRGRREICGKSGSAWNKLVKSMICLNINNLGL